MDIRDVRKGDVLASLIGNTNRKVNLPSHRVHPSSHTSYISKHFLSRFGLYPIYVLLIHHNFSNYFCKIHQKKYNRDPSLRSWLPYHIGCDGVVAAKGYGLLIEEGLHLLGEVQSPGKVHQHPDPPLRTALPLSAKEV